MRPARLPGLVCVVPLAVGALAIGTAALDARAQLPAPQAKATIAVLPLRTDALQLNEVKRLNFLVRQRAATRGGFEVQSEDTTTELLEASQSLGVDCDVNAVECGTQIGRIADVDRVLLGRVTGGLKGAAGATAAIGIDLTLVDVRGGSQVRRISALVPTEPTAQANAMNELAELLYGDTPLTAIELTIEPVGAEVLVNGVARGRAPLVAPVDALASGEHHVLVRKKGFLPFEARAASQPSEVTRLQVRLLEDPEGIRTANSPLAVAVPFIIAGGGAILAAGGGVLAAIGADPWRRYSDARTIIEGAEPTDAGYVSTVTEQWRVANAAAEEWESWGQGTTAAGVSLVSVGSAAAIGGLVVGVVLLTSRGGEHLTEH